MSEWEYTMPSIYGDFFYCIFHDDMSTSFFLDMARFFSLSCQNSCVLYRRKKLHSTQLSMLN